jgi:hypothetical protein
MNLFLFNKVWYDYLIKYTVNIFLNFKFYFMGNLLYIIAVILIIGWLLGLFAFHAGGIIHILLVIAIIAIIFQVIRGGRTGV